MAKHPYTQIDNLLLRCLCFLKYNQIRVMLFFIRYTAGFHTCRCRTTYKRIAKWCRMTKACAVRAVSELESLEL